MYRTVCSVFFIAFVQRCWLFAIVSMSQCISLNFPLLLTLKYCLNTTYNTSFRMHVMASTINLIETFSFYVGQMSGYESVHSLNIFIWATLPLFTLVLSVSSSSFVADSVALRLCPYLLRCGVAILMDPTLERNL